MKAMVCVLIFFCLLVAASWNMRCVVCSEAAYPTGKSKWYYSDWWYEYKCYTWGHVFWAK